MTQTIDVRGKVVLLSGASRGLGRAMAIGLARAGAKLAITARPGSDAKLADTVGSIGSPDADVLTLTGDIAQSGDCARFVESTLRRFGRIDALINNAGLGMDQLGAHFVRRWKFDEIPDEVWTRIVDTNINGTWLMSRAAVKPMLAQGSGRIVNLSTSFPTMIRSGFTPYGPTKAAIEAMTAAWADDYRDTGITVNALLPGWASDTDMIPVEDFPEREKLVPPSVMVQPALWLVSDASKDTTGMRVVAKDWDATLSVADAARAACSKAAW